MTRKHFMYYRVRHSDEEFPFSALNTFLNSILGELQRVNPHASDDLLDQFANTGHVLHLVAQVLPAIQKVVESKRFAYRYGESSIHVRHENMHSGLDFVLRTIIAIARLDVIILDDLQRADTSSFNVFERLVQDTKVRVKWVLGVRSYEQPHDKRFAEEFERLRKKEPTHEILATNERAVAWHTRLNSLRPETGRMLAAWTVVSFDLSPTVIEYMSDNIGELPNVIGDTYHVGKVSYAKVAEDAVGESPVVAQPALVRPMTKDLSTLAIQALVEARDNGLIVEERESQTGKLRGYHWSSERVALMLLLLLSREVRASLYYLLAKRLSVAAVKNLEWSQMLMLAEVFLNTDLRLTAHAAFGSLMLAAESLSDLSSVDYVIGRFQCLEERLERQRSSDAETLIPRIREQIGDLATMLEDSNMAVRYYQAVFSSMVDPKRRAVLSLKSWFPRSMKTREERVREFQRVMHNADRSGLLPRGRHHSNDLNKAIKAILERISQLLESGSFLEGRTIDAKSFSYLMSLRMSDSEAKQEKLPYSPRSRSIREGIVSQFLRSCLGWVDCDLLLPHVLNSLELCVDAMDGATIVQSLFTFVLCADRRLDPESRSSVFRAISEIAARINNDVAISEVVILKAWCQYFQDGNVHDSRRTIEGLKAHAHDLARSVRQCAEKLMVITEFEARALDRLRLDPETAKAKLRARLKAAGLVEWNLGLTVLAQEPLRVPLRRSDDESLVSSIVSEKIDQVMLSSYYCIEGSQYSAEEHVVTAAKEAGVRDWFSDASLTLPFLPALLAEKLVQATQGKSSFEEKLLSDRLRKGVRKTRIGPPSRFSRGKVKPEQEGKASGKDSPVRLHVDYPGYDRFVNPDPEQLTLVSRHAIQCGMLWLAHRLCRKAGLQLEVVVRDLQTEGQLPAGILQAVNEAEKTDSGEAIALNYVLEFIHNLHFSIVGSEASEGLDPWVLGQYIQKAVPPHEELIEDTIAQSLLSAAKRLRAIGSEHGAVQETTEGDVPEELERRAG